MGANQRDYPEPFPYETFIGFSAVFGRLSDVAPGWPVFARARAVSAN